MGHAGSDHTQRPCVKVHCGWVCNGPTQTTRTHAAEGMETSARSCEYPDRTRTCFAICAPSGGDSRTRLPEISGRALWAEVMRPIRSCWVVQFLAWKGIDSAMNRVSVIERHCFSTLIPKEDDVHRTDSTRDIFVRFHIIHCLTGCTSYHTNKDLERAAHRTVSLELVGSEC
jgi:hypothetical protein